jgi:antitoxin component of MazEF toxin-antitoxin module
MCIVRMVYKNTYVIQPYEVGSKPKKSLAIVIPANVAKELRLDKSTIFALRINDDMDEIVLQNLDGMIEENLKHLAASNQQASRAHADQ